MFRFPLSFLLLCIFVFRSSAGAQPPYTTAHAHAHNDYEQAFPFWEAYRNGFGSIEADIFLQGTQLLVAHEPKQLASANTLEALYLRPLDSVVRRHGGKVYADSSRSLQLMIDIKTAAIPALEALVGLLNQYPSLLGAKGLRFTISGNRPAPEQYAGYPKWLYFDGLPNQSYPEAALLRIAMVSDNFRTYSSWNGKGRIPEAERRKIVAAIEKAKAWGKPFRFWNAPDNLNSWYGLMELGVGFINTDHIADISRFLNQLPATTYRQQTSLPLYQPAYRNDGKSGRVRNVILLIGDGMGLPQLYAAYTANRGGLNIFGMRHTGLSKTSSYDHYITDSAPGSTAFASGEKTNNRAVGVDHTGKALPLLPQLLRGCGMRSGIITSGDITDATPADFYAHQPERSSSAAILRDLLATPVDLLMGAPASGISNRLKDSLAHTFSMYQQLATMPATKRFPLLVTDSLAGKPFAHGRGKWLQDAFAKSINLLNAEGNGFFLVAEGAQIDHGGHSNNLPWLVSELLDFDQVVAQAMRFADQDGETLVIVTADHETGGLTLHGGDYASGYVAGRFATDDHTAAPVPVFAYGPGAQLFGGVYENTAIFHKIMQALDRANAVNNP